MALSAKHVSSTRTCSQTKMRLKYPNPASFHPVFRVKTKPSLDEDLFGGPGSLKVSWPIVGPQPRRRRCWATSWSKTVNRMAAAYKITNNINSCRNSSGNASRTSVKCLTMHANDLTDHAPLDKVSNIPWGTQRRDSSIGS